ncbi:hypothetical protein Bca101_043098 [Brassica carinata]
MCGRPGHEIRCRSQGVVRELREGSGGGRSGKERVAVLEASLEQAEVERNEATRRAETLSMNAEDIAGRLKAARVLAEKLQKEKEQLEREKAEVAEEHAQEAARLRDSHAYEVTRERERVHAAMVSKAKAHCDQFLGREKRFDEYEDARCLYSQAFGTRKYLQLLKRPFRKRRSTSSRPKKRS